MENALAKSLPVVISFLASLLGLGGIAAKIQGIFQKLRKPVEKAVDWVIDKGTKAFKKIGNKVNNSKLGKKAGKLNDAAKEKYQAGKQWAEDKKQAGHQWVNDKKQAAEHWVEGKKKSVKDQFGKLGNKVKDKLGFGKDEKAKDGKADERTYKQKQADLELAIAEAEQLMQNEKLSFKDIKKQLPKIKAKYKMTTCKLVIDKDTADKTTAHIEAEINPKRKGQEHIREHAQEEKDALLPLRINKNKKGEVLPEIVKQEMQNATERPEQGEIGYVANVPAVAKSHSPKEIAQLYLQQGFSSPEEAKRRFGLVVGLNAYQNLSQEDAKETVKAKVKTDGWNSFRLGTFGFLWQAKWEKLEDANTPAAKTQKTATGKQNIKWKEVRINEAKQTYDGLSADKKAQIKQDEAENFKVAIPYDAIRNKVKDHSYTQKFVSDLSKNGNEVYILTADPDAISLKPTPKKEGTGDIPVQELADALFARYDKIIQDQTSKEGTPPAIVSGGYEFRLKIAGGQTEDALRVCANKLDMAVRQAMAKIDPFTVYFPEPNTIVKVNKGTQTIEVSFTSDGGKSEGQALVRKLRQSRKLQSKDVIFNLDASIETNSDRFKVTIGRQEVQINTHWLGGKLEGLTQEHIKALFNNSQTHAQKNYWIRRIMSQYPGGKQIIKGRGDAITDVYNHFFPNELIGFASQKLITELPRYPDVSGYNQLSEESINNLKSTNDYNAVIAIAKESGDAVAKFLKEVLGIK